MFIKALLVALYAFWIESPLTFNTRFFAFGRPLVSGLIVGLILGDPVKGTIIGATINAVYIGVIVVGDQTPADTRTAGVLGPALGILADMTPAMALAVVVPIALVGVSFRTLRQSFFSVLSHKADKYAEEDNPRGIAMVNVIPPIVFAFIYPGIATFLAVYYGPEAVEAVLGFLPAPLIAGLQATGKLLPAVGYSMLLHYMTATSLGMLPMFFIGFILAAFLGLDILAVVGIGICVAFMIYIPKTRGVGNFE
ncbi:PTS mannose/fructose/sorbose/N-acetylgalactosamine transporter subunit IIC [Brassicibacter mesophilus]|uniref:PTS mannose/fructose/sorbose/N-acetylgalactosamine transporter subunit IIC n=1 Tax=Brassicibacter mesophilus TaxID=745119 RepID=UPI003D21CC19